MLGAGTRRARRRAPRARTTAHATTTRMKEPFMYKLALTSIPFGIAVFFSGTTASQAPAPATPAPIPDAMPFDIPYGTPISFERAKQVGDAAMAEAKKRNWKDAIAVTGPAGDLVYFVRMDGTQY